MKRPLLALLICVTLLSALPVFASANQWGLTGALYSAVSDAGDTWDAYRASAQAGENLAIMKSRYHNVLLYLRDGVLRTYTKAVYQPETEMSPTLEETENGFILAYGPEERYTFVLGQEGYLLEQAQVGSLTLTGCWNEDGTDIYRYQAVQGADSAIWYAMQHLGDFNISLFPRSVDEIRRLNLLQGALSGGDSLFPRSDGDIPSVGRYAQIGKGTEAVYSAPYGERAWRAADGKAAVGLEGELWLLRTYYDVKESKAYACIRYAVSQRTQRIGFIRGTTLEPDADTAWATDESL